MQEEKIEIGTQGIKSAIKHALKKFDALHAIAEFIWNGFDAGASRVDIQYQANEIGHISELRIIDNGSGIFFPQLNKSFRPFLHSDKIIDPTAMQHGPSAIHGKNGIGRLTFFTFARRAEWETIYPIDTQRFKQFKIEIQSDKLNTFMAHPETNSLGPTGTSVRFTDLTINDYDFESIKEFLVYEFAWFLELKSPFERTISINGDGLKYDFLVGERDSTDIRTNSSTFHIRYVRWNERLHDEYSRFYFIDSGNHEKAKKTTTLNNKGDDFYHSVYVYSSYFNTLTDWIVFQESDNSSNQARLLLNKIEHEDEFRDLLEKLDEYLYKKRKPFLRKRAVKFVKELKDKGAFPKFSLDPWDQLREKELSDVIQDVYEADPRVFNGLNSQQKQTFVRLFNLAMNSSERDNLFYILDQVVNLESEKRAELANILQATRLSNIIVTIKLVEDRFTAVDELKKLVFNPNFGANERDHLQTHIERHYWLFGEQYHLVTSAEPDFEQALHRYIHYLYGESEPRSIDHPDKNKEMDIFAVRWLKQTHEINNIVLELKHPKINLGEKELSQVKSYMRVILKQPEFNASNMTWEFYLVGNDYDNSIIGEIESNEANGERHLAFKGRNYKIYVLKWSEVITNFELRHNFILDKLKLERDKIATDKSSADEILAQGHKNTASL